MTAPRQRPCPKCGHEDDPGDCCGYEGTKDGFDRQEAARIECSELANVMYPINKPDKTPITEKLLDSGVIPTVRCAIEFAKLECKCELMREALSQIAGNTDSDWHMRHARSIAADALRRLTDGTP
jgi:hypothetical protein